MRARDLAVALTSGNSDSVATEASRLMAEGEPPDSSPPIDDPSPTSVVDEKNADRLCQALRGRTVAGALPP
ncbi:hypothetical protein [Streptomyces sp. NPDC056983]|uniref:hypothetical protein n=1 Tax=Streptomyces sp. NPDC056983 TaxID=3345987 RepID=UPI003625AEAA